MEQPKLHNFKALQVFMSFPSQWIGTQGPTWPCGFPDRTEPHRNIILDTRRPKSFQHVSQTLWFTKISTVS